MPSLRDIEKTVGTVWLNREVRNWIMSGANKSKAPAIAEQLNSEVIAQLDRKGAALYGRLINFGHHDLIESIFPFCKKAIADDWDSIVEKYFHHYPSDHYNLNKICRHFSQFLSDHGGKLVEKYPYLPELADYEWLELEKLEDQTDIIRAEQVSICDLQMISKYAPVVNQTLILCKYDYPIAEIANNFESAKRPRKKFAPKKCNLCIYRDPDTHRVRFVELGEASAAIVETAAKQATVYQDLLRQTIDLTPELSPQTAALEFIELVEGLQTDNIFVGSLIKGEK